MSAILDTFSSVIMFQCTETDLPSRLVWWKIPDLYSEMPGMNVSQVNKYLNEVFSGCPQSPPSKAGITH